MPKISVIVPVYKVEPYLRRCIDSILAQTFEDFELILVDDGSPDGCPAICDEYAEKDNRIRVIHKENGGLSSARNAGIDWVFENSDSEWITFVDSDDWIHSEMLKILYNAVIENDVHISVCDYYISTERKGIVNVSKIRMKKIGPEEAYVRRGGLIDMAWGKLCHRECFRTVRYPTGKIFEDAWTMYKIFFSVKAVVMINEKLYCYFVNENSITRSNWNPSWISEVEAHEEQLLFFERNRLDSALKEAIQLYFSVLSKQQIHIKKSEFDATKYEKLLFKNGNEVLRRYKRIIPKEKYKNWYEWSHPAYSTFKGIQRSLIRKTKSLVQKIINGLYTVVKNILEKCLIKKIREKRYFKKLNEQSAIEFKSAEQALSRFHCQKKPSFSQKSEYNPIFDLMIIVPVYNAEKYIIKCAESIINQNTSFSYKIVFVDDGTPDDSGRILDRYKSYENVEIIHQENRGHSGARNRALEKIEGKYVMFVDSDDYISKDAVEVLLSAAFKYDADIVEGGYRYVYEKSESNPITVVSEESVVECTELTGYPCMKVIRGEKLLNTCFPQGLWYEDTIIGTIIYPECKKFVAIPDVVYYYRQNPNSISATSKLYKKCVDTYWITRYYLEEKKNRNHVFGERECEQFLLQVKRNQFRVQNMPMDIQESIFVLSSRLHKQYFYSIEIPSKKALQKLVQCLDRKSFKAYLYLIENWDKFSEL